MTPEAPRPSAAPPYPHAPLPEWWWERTLTQRRVIAGIVAFVLVLGVAGLVMRFTGGGSDDTTTAEAGTDAAAVEPTPEPDPVDFVATLSPERVAIWDQLAECETRSDWTSNTGNGFFGGLQFTLETWQGVGGSGQPDQTSREEQIMRAERLYELQGWGAWPGCAQELGLG